jgi:hypothetical protein
MRLRARLVCGAVPPVPSPVILEAGFGGALRGDRPQWEGDLETDGLPQTNAFCAPPPSAAARLS